MNEPTYPAYDNTPVKLRSPFQRMLDGLQTSLECKDGNVRIVLLAVMAGVLSIALLMPIVLS